MPTQKAPAETPKPGSTNLTKRKTMKAIGSFELDGSDLKLRQS